MTHVQEIWTLDKSRYVVIETFTEQIRLQQNLEDSFCCALDKQRALLDKLAVCDDDETVRYTTSTHTYTHTTGSTIILHFRHFKASKLASLKRDSS